jgi:hypothetical protein
MLPGHRSPWGLSLLAALLIAVVFFETFLASRTKSPAFDETGDIAAGLAYLQTGEVRANPQHPPLLKYFAGLPLWLAGVRLPNSPRLAQMLAGEGGERAVGSQLIAANGPDRVMLLARLPFMLVATLLGLLLYVWGRRLTGGTAALCALFLYALDPTFLAHAYLTTMDAGLAAFAVLFLFALWNYLHRPGLARLALCGLALGLVLAAKFTALVLLPVTAILLAAAIRRPPEPGVAAPDSILDIYCHSRPATAVLRGYGAGVCALLALCTIAGLVVQALYLSPGGLYLYASGLDRVNSDHTPGYQVFLAGGLQHSFATYFPAAYLLKQPIPILLLSALGLFTLLRAKTIAPLAKLFLTLPPAVLFAVHMLWADNLGVRYLLPVLPFAYLIGGVGAAWLLHEVPRWGRPVAAVLALWTAVTAAAIYPDHLAYFNEAACLLDSPRLLGLDGGTRCGPAWLDDSNVDWGQGLKQLKAWADRNAPGRTIRLGYFGSFPPAAYGLAQEPVTIEQLQHEPTPGLYAISAHLVARAPALSPGGSWLRRTPPTAIAGHAFYIYDIGAAR